MDMKLRRFLDNSSEYCERLHDLLHGEVLPSDERTFASAACLHLALEHHRAVILLYSKPLVISAGALLRPQLEAYVKGAWLNRCATETQVRHFQKNKNLPTFGSIVSVLEKTISGYGPELASIKKQAWRPLSSYVHSGAVQAERRKTESEIVARYSSAEIAGGLHFSNRIGVFNAVEIAVLSGNEQLSNDLWQLYAAYSSNTP